MKIVICNSCGEEKKHHAKGFCKPCYCKTDHYKQLRKISDKDFQTKNKEHINSVRKARRSSDTYKESDDYVKNIINMTYGIPRKISNVNPDFVQSKKVELKLKRIIKKMKKDGN